jgi:hypothetical protein
MDEKLRERIEVARREMRIARGESLNPDELEAERRKKAVADLQREAHQITFESKMTLWGQPVWESEATIRIVHFNEPGRENDTFYLRPMDEEVFRLFHADIPEGNEVLLGTIPRKDSQFVNCVLVAVGDALEKQEGA